MLDEMDAMDWDSVPGPPGWYEPGRVARGLRSLSEATNPVQAAQACSELGGGGLVHGHSAAVFPAAVLAAPLLLKIAQYGHPAARNAALVLLDEALSWSPHAGYARVAVPDGMAAPLCCAIAHHLRDHADFLVGLGRDGKSLLVDAAEHWRFEISECVADGSDSSAFGTVAGSLPEGVFGAEMHHSGVITVLSKITVEYPSTADSPESCLRVFGRHPDELPPTALLLPAVCGQRLH